MRHLRKFEQYEDFLATQEAVSGSGKYVEDIFPGFAYVKENYPESLYAFFNGHDEPAPEGYEFGDIIYYDGSEDLKKVYWSAFTPSMGEKVGLVVVPTALAPDGNARIMAFGSITGPTQAESPVVANSTEPNRGDTVLGESMSYDKVYPSWYNNFMDENQTVYTCLPGFYLEGEGGGGKFTVENSGLLGASVPGNEGQPTHYESPVSLAGLSEDPSIFSSDAHYMYPNPYTNGEYYNTGDTLVAISPFLGDSLKEQDPAYLQEELQGGSLPSGGEIVATGKGSLGGGNYNAFSDFSGYTWTYGCPPEREEQDVTLDMGNMRSSKPVGPVLGAYFPHNYARLFHTDGTQAGDWYLPSMGEMGFFIARYKMIVEEIMPYLYSVGAWATDGSDNIPGLNNTGDSQYSSGLIWISTVGARSGGVGPIYNEAESVSPALLGASIAGDDTYPTVYPMLVTVIAQRLINEGEGGVAFGASDPNVLGGAVAPSGTISNQSRYNLQFALNYNGGGGKAAPASSNPYEVLPFAMIKEGKIQRTMGDYTAANGHQVKDFYVNTPKE